MRRRKLVQIGRGPLLIACGVMLFSGVAIAQSGAPDGSTEPTTEKSPWVQSIAEDRDAVVQHVLDHPFLKSEGLYSDAGELRTVLNSISDDRLLRAAEAKNFDDLDAAIAGEGAGGDGAAQAPPVTSNAFGDATTDLVYTPVEPCRLFDTRLDSRGLMTSNEIRNFAVQGAFVSDQGGHSSDCPAVPFDPPAVMIAIIATNAVGNGNARVYSALGAVPSGATLNYQPGTNIANTTASPVCISCGVQTDVAVKVTVNQAQVLGDIVGYFSRGPACPAGTTASGGNCFDTVLRTPDATFFNASGACEGLGRRLPTVGELLLVLNQVTGDNGGEHSDSTYFDSTFRNMRITASGGLVNPTSTLQADPYRCVSSPT